jgi:hypothetical protein
MAKQSSRDPREDPAALLGLELKRIREAAGFASQDALARALGFTRTVIGKAESGERVPTRDVFYPWLDACRLAGEVRDMLIREYELVRNLVGIPLWFMVWIDIEKRAEFIRVWQPLLMPGLLQIEDYMRAMYLAAGVDEDKTEERVAARVERQAILDGDAPVHLTVLIAELVLDWLVGTPKVMAAQLAHVLGMSRRGNISVQVVRGMGATAGMSGAFDIATGPEFRDTMRMSAVEDQTTDTPELVRQAALVFEEIRGHALNVAESRAVIVEAIERWKSQQ